MHQRNALEKILESLLFNSRWLLAPFYVGLVVSLMMLLVAFIGDLAHLVPNLLQASPEDIILGVLTLIDLSLAGNLVVIVMFSGYENFVSALDVDAGSEKLSWLGKLDANSLKLKVASSIVAISSIHLLRRFMEADDYIRAGNSDTLMWFVIIHLTFVASAVMMGVLDRITSGQHHGHKGEA
jgi:uncharacterized protein (TIGR00645 family)